MKLTQRDFTAQMHRAAQTCRIFFFCGPDEAGASAAANALIEQLPDVDEKVELAGSDLKGDAGRLGDEARSSSLFGGSRFIYARVAGDEAHDALQTLIETGDAGGGEACPLVIVATSATDKSRTAKLLEKRKDALVAMFWPPDLRSVTQSVRAMGDSAGVRLNGDLAERIARGANLDVRLAQSEVTKLATYLDASPQSPVAASAEDLFEIGAVSEEEGFMPLVNAVFSGEVTKLPAELKRMREVSLNPVGLLLACERRAAQLGMLAGKVGTTGAIAQTLEAEQKARRIFWRDRRDLEDQLRRWRGKELSQLTSRLMEMHRELLTNSQASELLLAQGLTRIARAAAKR
ncbi:DNA polymerase III subunit delta [Qipengyuania atrilutea]|uniref:DNA-directed DNA polymerase n=1 Tax=Qipengyuania atrilutea TaxID=2744473 RepID=A0A850HBZ3_9SPHN|nr:DNA polymerase III subunit delta [Actirhodobacter atriluteus]NVD44609.1 DNA polymerase III subunit delta [Actirhodobacter atriluteus]